MKYYGRVPADRYEATKRHYENMGLPTDHLIPVDMNDQFVAMDKSDKNIKMSAHDAKERLGGE